MAINFQTRISEESKMRLPDRVLLLKVKEGMKPLDSGMRVDPRLLKQDGETNRLHAKMDLETSLWSLHYEKGSVPPALNSKYTGFKQALDAARNYFTQRNIEIIEVKD